MIDAGAAMMLGVGAILVVLPTVAMIIAYLSRRLQSQERLKAIEHGQMLAFDPLEIALRTRRSGIVLIAAGISTGIAVAIVAAFVDSDALAGLGLGIIPLFIGIGLLIDYKLQMRQLKGSK